MLLHSSRQALVTATRRLSTSPCFASATGVEQDRGSDHAPHSNKRINEFLIKPNSPAPPVHSEHAFITKPFTHSYGGTPATAAHKSSSSSSPSPTSIAQQQPSPYYQHFLSSAELKFIFQIVPEILVKKVHDYKNAVELPYPSIVTSPQKIDWTTPPRRLLSNITDPLKTKELNDNPITAGLPIERDRHVDENLQTSSVAAANKSYLNQKSANLGWDRLTFDQKVIERVEMMKKILGIDSANNKMVTSWNMQRAKEMFQRKEGDTGSSEVQVAVLTVRINNLRAHLDFHRRDIHSRRGLTMLISKREKLLKYLRRQSLQRHYDCVKRLELA